MKGSKRNIWRNGISLHHVRISLRATQCETKDQQLKPRTYKQPHGTTCIHGNSHIMNVPSLFSILQDGQWVTYNTAPRGISSGARFDPPGLCPLAKRIIALQMASFVKLGISLYPWDFKMALLIRSFTDRG